MDTLILGWYGRVESGSAVQLTRFGAPMHVGTLLSPLLRTWGGRVGLRRVLAVAYFVGLIKPSDLGL